MITYTFVTLITLSLAAKLPPTFKKCNRNSNDLSNCLANALEDAMKQLVKPIRESGLPSLKPLEVASLRISGGTRAVGLEQNYRNIKIFGFTDVHCTRFDVDFEKGIMSNECFYPEIRMESEYEAKGKVLLIDVYGKGPSTITLVKVNIPVNYTLEEYKKSGQKYYRVLKTDLIMKPELVKFKFENLFDGDKLLGDNINQVINDNWQDIFTDVKSNYEEAFAQITTRVFNVLLSKVPVSEFFDDE